jgi:hypothetical protein
MIVGALTILRGRDSPYRLQAIGQDRQRDKYAA